MLTIWQLFQQRAALAPQSRLTFHTSGITRSVSFRELHDDTLRLAAALADRGLRQGDCIVVQLPHCPENLTVFLASAALGLVFIPVVHILGPAELRFILEQSGARLLVLPRNWHHHDFVGRARELESLTTLEQVLMTGGAAPELHKAIGWDQFLGAPRGPAALPQIDPTAPCLMLYTSGTTAAPKGVLHSHATLIAEGTQIEPVLAKLRSRDVLVAAPAGHIGPISALIRQLLFGIEGVYLDRWDAETAVDLIGRYRIGWSVGVPMILASLLPAAEAGRIPSLELFIAGGTSVPPVLVERAERAGIKACRSYGSSEHPTLTQGDPDDVLAKRAGTDGRVCAGCRLRIVDDDGNDVAAGEPGEVIAYGPESFLGYYDVSLNAAAFTADGGVRTGDIGALDADGYLCIVDRKKDIIIRNGENLSSREIEDVVSRHPAVLEAAAVGWPDPVCGERVGVFVRIHEAALAPTLESLRQLFEASGLARQKHPERLVVLGQLPRNPSGKVLKNVLRKLAAERSAV